MRRVPFVSFLALTTALPISAAGLDPPTDTTHREAAVACFVGKGTQDSYGTEDQGRELQQSVRRCGVVGIIWKIASMPQRYSEMYWDIEAGILVRFHREPARITWERWTGATWEAMQHADFADGFVFESYERGEGPPPLTDRMDQAIHGKSEL